MPHGVFPELSLPWQAVAINVGPLVGLPLLAALAAGATWHTGHRYRLVGALLGAAGGFVLVASVNFLLAPLACPAGYLVGILAGELAGPRRPTGSVRHATLAPRRLSDYAPHRALALAALFAALMVAAPVVLAIVPHLVSLTWRPGWGGSGAEFPAQRVPLLGPAQAAIMAAIALGGGVLGLLTLRRVTFGPAPLGLPGATGGGRQVESGWATAGAAVALESFCLSQLLVVTGFTLSSLPHVRPAAAAAVGLGLIWAGLGVYVVGLLAWVALAHRGRSSRLRLARVPVVT